MPMQSRLDLSRLKRDLAASAKARDGMTLAPGGRAATGLMAMVRDNLDALLALKASGSTWKEIAAGLTAQGYATADGRPLTDTQLTGVISSVRRQARRRAARAALRDMRPDLAAAPLPPRRPAPASPSDAGARRARLAPELTAGSPPESGEPPMSEAEIRDHHVTKHKHLFRKDPE
ncbi:MULTISPECIES: hypothetical protein [Methylobacteriaceae]|jgi:hypothetical protein|uniref:Uncharacterized protein n=6 Tax=Methylobacteriaceae TaxID=119045 RepID=A0A0J6T0F3_9HYPH|nr:MULTISPECIES: hypothetical protein [Methylobacteriaceae]MBY0139870.1 hypothetical protein [Methylorubrum populi]MBZ6416250.1 hypothetical protein [Methylobacterium sp.]MDV2988236.1 hypothetical protein [Methylobacteriaceae bacterium AG10]KMO39469.1 hypothetical protein VQ02_10065 [Methylobacterium variabile]MBD8908086.1 hypothetical protein [Methylorubrum zatmanii]